MPQVFLDTFTEPTTNTALQSHTPDVGTSWTKQSGTNNLQVYEATDDVAPSADNNNELTLYTANPASALGTADYDVIVTKGAGGATQDRAGCYGRRLDNSNYYFAVGRSSSAGDTFLMGKVVAGIHTLLGFGGSTAGSADVLKLQMRGDQISMLLNDVLIAGPVTDNSLTAAGDAGLIGGAIANATDDWRAAHRITAFEIVTVGLEELAPNERVSGGTNLQDTSLNSPPTDLTDIQDDPDSPDADWWTAVTVSAGIDVVLGFTTPSTPPTNGQTFKIWARKTAGSPNPLMTVYLYENGSQIGAALRTDVLITSESGQLVEAYWNAGDLATADGSLVQVRIVGTAAA